MTQVNADSLVLAWSPEGKMFAYLDESGRIFTVDRATKKVTVLWDTNGEFGGFDWR